MRIAVIGAGVFGCTAAITCARAGHEVHLFDKSGQVMTGASFCNQLRAHRGYHYPRSRETVDDCKNGLLSFTRAYSEALDWSGVSHYAIANRDTQTSVAEYEAFCAEAGLPLHRTDFPGLFNVSAVYEVTEGRIDYPTLRKIVGYELEANGVLFRGTEARNYRREYDHIIVAAYSGMNDALTQLGCPTHDYQYEVVEKPVVKMPSGFDDKTGVVVMDGPFFSLDPYGSTGLHLMGHVEEAIWQRSFGEYPTVPERLTGYINSGIIADPDYTRFPDMREAAEEFLPCIRYAEHLGSMYTVRAVLPFVDDTDERPTVVTQIDDQVTTVFSGKIPTCVDAASSVLAILSKKDVQKKEAA